MPNFKEENNLLGGYGGTQSQEKLNNRVFPKSHCFSLPQGVTLFQATTTPHLDECRILPTGPQASAPALPQETFNLVEG